MTRPVTMDIIARDKATTTTNKIAKSVDGLAKQTTATSASMTKSYNSAGKSVQQLERTHQSSVSHINGALKTTATVAKFGVLALGGVGLAAGLMGVSAVKSGLQTAAAMEQAQIAFGTLLGSGQKAQKFLDQLSVFAAKTPFEMPGLIDASRQLLGVGVASKDIIPTLTAYGDAAGALGISQDGFNHIMLATSQALSAGTLHAGDLLQMTEAGLPVWTLLSKALHKPVSELRKLSENGKLMTADVLPKLQAQMEKDYGGAMIKQSHTLAGLWSTLMDTFHMGMAKALLPLEPMLRTLIPKAAAFMSNALAGLGKTVAAFLGALMNGDVTSKGFIGAVERVGVAVRTVALFIHDHWSQITATFKAVGIAIQAAVKAIVIAIVWLRDNVIIPTVNWITVHWPQIAGAFVKAWVTIQPTVMALWRLLQNLWKQILQPLVAWVQAHWPQISAVLKVVGIAAGIVIVTMIKALQLLAWYTNWLVVHVIGPMFRLMLNIISGTAAAVIRVFNALKVAWQATYNFIAAVGGAIINWFKLLPGRIWAWIKGLPGTLLQLGKDLITKFRDGIAAEWHLVANFVASIPGWIGSAISGVGKTAWNWVVNIGKNILTHMKDGVVSAATGLLNWFKDLPKNILKWAGFGSPPSWAYQAGKWIIEGVANGMKNGPTKLADMLKKSIGVGGGAPWWQKIVGHGLAALFPGGSLLAGAADLASLGSPLGGAKWNQAALAAAAKAGGAGGYQAYAASLFGGLGWAADQLQPLISLWNLESGWNPAAMNASSGAYGIPQALPATKIMSEGDLHDPYAQIRWGLKYIKDRYGSPAAAWAFETSHTPNWYKAGAWNIARDELAYLHRGEMVVPEPAASQVRAGASGGLSARAIAAAVADALSGAVFRFDGDGLATLVTRRQDAFAVRGGRR